jgi:hypothetical protein
MLTASKNLLATAHWTLFIMTARRRAFLTMRRTVRRRVPLATIISKSLLAWIRMARKGQQRLVQTRLRGTVGNRLQWRREQ